jgi:cleavage stimulation factor subunit 2
VYEIMAQTKALASANPGQARTLLTSNPQLTRALFQAQLLLGMVRSPAEGVPVTSSALPAAPAPLHSAPLHAGLAPPALVPQAAAEYGNAPPPWLQPQLPGGGAQPPGLGETFASGMPATHAPPAASFSVAPPPHVPQSATWGPGAPPQLPGPLAGMDVAQQQALLAQVMRLSDAQVAALPEAEQEQVRLLQGLARQHLAAGQRF